MKINYYQESCKTLEQLEGTHPKLLLHACCAPCAVWPLKFLSDHFQLTILYNNSNIYPASEYQRRLDELKRVLHLAYPQVELLVPAYDNDAYTARLAPLKDEPERGKRCRLCYALRLKEGFETAARLHFDYYCTVMTISRQKDSQVINEIAAKLARQYLSVHYFYSDFKKADGILKGNALAREYNCYRQDYCGCRYSFEARQKKLQEKAEKTL